MDKKEKRGTAEENAGVVVQNAEHQWTGGEMCWRASPLATEECTGGWVGLWMGGIYHYWLVPPSLAQADIPPAIDINHDFSIIDPLSAMEGKNVLFISISVSPHSSFPHFGSVQWCIIIIRYHWFGIRGMPGKSLFVHGLIWMHDIHKGVNNTESAELTCWHFPHHFCGSQRGT